VSYKEGHAPIGRLTIKDIWGDDRGRQIQSKFDRRFGWAISQVRASGYLESSGVNIPEMRSPKISRKKSQVMTRGHMKRWRGVTLEAEVAHIFTEEELRGLKASGLT
jgi:hypothetical protein